MKDNKAAENMNYLIRLERHNNVFNVNELEMKV